MLGKKSANITMNTKAAAEWQANSKTHVEAKATAPKGWFPYIRVCLEQTGA